jgi:hypothetical protein
LVEQSAGVVLIQAGDPLAGQANLALEGSREPHGQ